MSDLPVNLSLDDPRRLSLMRDLYEVAQGYRGVLHPNIIWREFYAVTSALSDNVDRDHNPEVDEVDDLLWKLKVTRRAAWLWFVFTIVLGFILVVLV